MRLMSLSAAAAAGIMGLASAASAITIDGTKDSGYGSALSIQANNTGFGDSTTNTQTTAGGSEIDGLYATVSGGTLYVIATGNLETNFNKLDFFIDNGTGTGQNTLGALSNNQGSFNNMTGLTFDTGFSATRWIAVTAGNTPTSIYVDTADLSTANTSTTGYYAGTNNPVSTGALSGGNGGPASLLVTLDDSNNAGVVGNGTTGAADQSAAAAVNTGVELAISLADLGVTGNSLKIVAFINGSGQDYLSNQVAGTLPAGTGNLAGPAAVNFANIAGNQFVTVSTGTPEPASLGLLSVAAVAGLRRRRA